MEFTSSTISQTPKLSINRPYSTALRFRNSVESPKLRESFERNAAEQELQLIRNRFSKLLKIDSVMKKEIIMAAGKSNHLAGLQEENYLSSQRKKKFQEDKRKNIDEKRHSFSWTRAQRKEKKDAFIKECYLEKKRNADVLKELKHKWDQDSNQKKLNETNRKLEFAQRVKLINNRTKELRSISQASNRGLIRKRYSQSIDTQKSIATKIRSKILKLELKELEIIQNLSNTITMRNQRLSDLQHLMEISKIPVSKRYN